MPSHHKRVSSTALTSCPSWELIQHYPFNITLTSLTHLGAGASLTNCPYPALSDILTGTRLLVTKRAGILFHELFCDCTALSNILIGTRLLVTKRVGILFHKPFCDCTVLSNILIGTRLLVTKRVGILFYEPFCDCTVLSNILIGTRLLVTKRVGILFHKPFCDCTALSNILIGTRLLVTKRVGIAFHESFWRHMVTAQHLATFWLAQGYWSPRELELCLMSLSDNTWCHPQQAQSIPPPPWRTPIPFLPCVKPAAADHLIYYLH